MWRGEGGSMRSKSERVVGERLSGRGEIEWGCLTSREREARKEREAFS